MAEAVADDLDVDPRGEGDAGVRVAHVVQPNAGHSGLVDELAEQVGDAVGAQQPTVLTGKDEPLVVVGGGPGAPLGVLAGAVVAQDGDRRGVQRDDAVAGVRLRGAEPWTGAGVSDLPLDAQVSALEIDVGPVQP